MYFQSISKRCGEQVRYKIEEWLSCVGLILLFQFSDTDQTMIVNECGIENHISLLQNLVYCSRSDSNVNLESIYIRSIYADHHIFISTRTMCFAFFWFGKQYLSRLPYSTVYFHDFFFNPFHDLCPVRVRPTAPCCLLRLMDSADQRSQQGRAHFCRQIPGKRLQVIATQNFAYLFCRSVQGFSFTGQEVCALSSWQNQRGQFEKLFEDSIQRASHSH